MKKANLITSFLLIYLIVMAVIGWEKLAKNDHLIEYISILGVSLIVIILLRLVLIKKYKYREENRKKRDASERRCYRDDQIL